jgi:hypothetical protein
MRASFFLTAAKFASVYMFFLNSACGVECIVE